LNKNYSKIGTLSNQGARPQAPYYEDLFVQELETGADTYQFSTISSPYTQDILEIGNHIMFTYKNRNELFTITSLEYSHNEGYKTIGVYAEGIGFDLLEVYMKRPENEKEDSSDGNDSDGDGDDNTDDEYADPDDVYIDENGNIIYDKYGQDDYADPDNVSIDGDGNIIYRRNKRNRKKDSLEFKNISYSRFLSILLKNSGWSYVCQPGLESVKHDITVRYDTNIFALLQDSMQSYRGVELEFVHELVGGRVQKVIKAYKDGGRGSFIGKRFEYGVNVRGITKMQEVTDSEDDTILYIDNVGVDVTYDVDFALKSAEVPEIEIGDTHYVIDKDFYPPMTIKARIGKIEVSFSDPTRNKIYLANNKKIRGSAIEDEFNEDDIKDIIDDYDDDDGGYDDGGVVTDHDHTCLRDYSEPSYIFLRHESLPDTYTCPFTGYEYTDRMYLEPFPHGDTYSAIGGTYEPWNFIYGNWVNCKRLTATDARSVISKNIENSIYVDSLGVRSTRYMVKMPNNRIENATTMSTKDLYDFIKNLTICKYTNKEETTLLDDGNSYTFGIYNADNYADSGNSIAEGIFRKLYNISNGNTERVGSGFIENSLLCALIGAFQQHIGAGDDGGDSGEGNTPGSGSYGDITCDTLTVSTLAKAGFVETGQLEVGLRAKINELSVLEGMTASFIEVGIIKFADGSTLSTANGGGTGGGTPSTGNVFDTITVRKIQGPDPGEGQFNVVQFEDAIMISKIWGTPDGSGNEVIEFGDSTFVIMKNGLNVDSGDVNVDGDVHANEIYVSKIVFPDNSELTTANGTGSSGGSGSGSSTDNITASKITIGTPTDNKASKCSLCVKGNTLVEGNLYIEGGNGLYVNGTPGSDKSLKENIRYVDNTGTIIVDKENLETRDYHNEDLLEKTDLHDFIVNQVNICEYNFIGKDRNKIGFIANEYEGTKVGDKIVSRDKELDLLFYDSDNLLFATIGALQEEVRTKDEKIASLEARLARIEAMLGINNNDN
jgi:hypothetical protein